MFKREIMLLAICLIMAIGLLGNSIAAFAQDGDTKSGTNNLMAYVMKDGKITWLLPDEGTKGLTEEEYKKKFQMSAEAEAAIVHDVPPCPIIIDGILYEPEQIHLFDGQQLGFTVGNDGNLYAFTTEEGIDNFVQEQITSLSESKSGSVLTRDIYSYFYEDAGYTEDFLAVPPGYPQGYVPDLGTILIDMDNMISSLIVSSSASTMRLWEDTNYQGDYFQRYGGSIEPSLSLYGWNDKASSLYVY